MRQIFDRINIFPVKFGDFSKVAACDVVMNASGVGMGKSQGQTPLPVEYIKPTQFYFDACYNPAKTQFLINAEAKKIIYLLLFSSAFVL